MLKPPETFKILGEAYLSRSRDRLWMRARTRDLAEELQGEYLHLGTTVHSLLEDNGSYVHTLIDTDRKVQVVGFVTTPELDEHLITKVLAKAAR